MDLQMPEMDGLDAISTIRGEFPDARIIVLTTYTGDVQALRALKAGARGYLLKDTFPEGTLGAIRDVHAGGRLFAPQIAAKLAGQSPKARLNAKEIAVLELVARGLSNGEIGAALSVSAGTIKTHLKRIFPKLGGADRTAAALVAVQQGIIRLP